jgi:hypothetical protein
LRFILIASFLFLAATPQRAAAQSAATDNPEANPGRPTVSTPATLTPLGYLQFETGFTPAYNSPEFSSLYNLNEAIKLSVAPRLEFLAVAEPIAHFTVDGNTANRVADIFLGAQFVIYKGEGAKPTLAVSYFHRVYDGGAPEFDLGSPVNSLLILASADVKGFHYDANAFFPELTQGPVRRAQFGQSLTISHLFKHRFTLSGEIWHFTQPFLQSNAVGNLWAVSYSLRNNLVFDAGFNRGLTDTSTKWEAFAGFTYLLPHRLWKTH